MSELQLAMTAPGDFEPKVLGMAGLRRNRAASETRHSRNLARKWPQLENPRTVVWILHGSSGRGGIRTPEKPEPLPDFKSGAFNRSATLPKADVITDGESSPRRGAGQIPAYAAPLRRSAVGRAHEPESQLGAARPMMRRRLRATQR